MVYMRHRRWLPKRHPYRFMEKKFDNTIEKDSAPPILKGKQIYDQLKHLKVVHGKGFKPKVRRRCKGKEKETVIDDQPKKKPVWKKRSIFWDLPYWDKLSVRHCIDVMHVEKNFLESKMIPVSITLPNHLIKATCWLRNRGLQIGRAHV